MTRIKQSIFSNNSFCNVVKMCSQDKKKVTCRQDWHQTANTVFVTVYAKNANPEFSSVEANRTVVGNTYSLGFTVSQAPL